MEATQKDIEQQNEAIIQEMLRNAKPSEIESELTKNPIIHKGDKDLEAPMVVNSISSAGYVWIWETDTHERVPCLYYMLPQKLRSRRKDGSYRFTTIEPKEKPVRGQVKCMLHEDHPNRAHYKELGFRTCPKATITSHYQLEQHMLKRHPQEWKAIEQERINKEKAEDRALQRLILQQMAPKTEPLIVDKEEPVPTPETLMEQEVMYQCSKCEKPHMYNSSKGKEHLQFKK